MPDGNLNGVESPIRCTNNHDECNHRTGASTDHFVGECTPPDVGSSGWSSPCDLESLKVALGDVPDSLCGSNSPPSTMSHSPRLVKQSEYLTQDTGCYPVEASVSQDNVALPNASLLDMPEPSGDAILAASFPVIPELKPKHKYPASTSSLRMTARPLTPPQKPTSMPGMGRRFSAQLRPRGGWSVGKLKEWIGRSSSPRTDASSTALLPESLRPCGLPPKSEKEAREHARKIEELHRDQQRLERKREEAEARRQKQLLQKDHFMQKARDIWKTQIIPNWETECNRTYVRKLWMQGLPDSVRKDIWPLAIDNALKITPDLFEILKEKVQEARKNRPPLSPLSSSSSSNDSEDEVLSNAEGCASVELVCTVPSLGTSATTSPVGSQYGDAMQALERVQSEEVLSRSSSNHSIPSQQSDASPQRGEGDTRQSTMAEGAASPVSDMGVPGRAPEPLSKENTASLIQLDLRRTFPQLQFYREGPEHDNLYMVLDAYVHYRPDVGYVQGMTYLAAILLLYMDCYTAFVCLVNMLSKYHFLSFFRMELREMNVHLLTFDMLLREVLPNIHEAFRYYGLRVEFYCIDWFVTLYSKSLPLDVATRVWDLFFLDPDYLYKVGLGIIKFYMNNFINADFEDMFEFITHLPKKMNETSFFNVVLSIEISRSRLKAIKEEAKRNASDRIG